jgi:hypothetical protein
MEGCSLFSDETNIICFNSQSDSGNNFTGKESITANYFGILNDQLDILLLNLN